MQRPLFIPSNNPVSYTKTVEIQLKFDAQNQAKFPFPLDNELNNKTITGLEVFANSDFLIAPSGFNVMSNVQLGQTLVTLKDGADVKIDAIPANTFVRTRNAGIRYEFKNFKFNMQTSFIRIVGNIPAGTSFFCAFTYVK